jgi:hypothetical protein
MESLLSQNASDKTNGQMMNGTLRTRILVSGEMSNAAPRPRQPAPQTHGQTVLATAILFVLSLGFLLWTLSLAKRPAMRRLVVRCRSRQLRPQQLRPPQLRPRRRQRRCMSMALQGPMIAHLDTPTLSRVVRVKSQHQFLEPSMLGLCRVHPFREDASNRQIATCISIRTLAHQAVRLTQ